MQVPATITETLLPHTGFDTETNTTQDAAGGGLGTWRVYAVAAHAWVCRADHKEGSAGAALSEAEGLCCFSDTRPILCFQTQRGAYRLGVLRR